MTEMASTDILSPKQQENKQQNICCQAGFLPVPLQHIPPASLVNLNLYLEKGGNYSLYRKDTYRFTENDKTRLIKMGIDFLYISVQDHHHYYQAIEESLSKIIKAPKILIEKKAEILYSTSLELANQLMAGPLETKDISRTRRVAQSTVQMIINNSNAFERLSDISHHDFYTATHMVNVCTSVVFMATKMGMSDVNTLEKIGTGAMLHDIGKLFIPSEILNAPGKLTAEQRTTVEGHVELGCDHLESVMGHIDPEIYSIVAEHHERMDGSGYPWGLKGSKITPIGRLAGIIDTYEAMTSVRPYRKNNFSMEEALDYLNKNSDKYDKDMVKAFTTAMQESSGMVAKGKKRQEEQEEIEDIIDKPEISVSGRRHKRYHFRKQVSIRKINNVNNKLTLGDNEKVILHNISVSGAGILSPRAIPINKNFCITIPDINEGKPLNLSATVIRCFSHNDGWFTIGAQFHKQQNENFIKGIRKIFM